MKRGVNGLILCIQFLLSFICTSVREQQCCIGNIWPTFVTIVLASNCSNFDSCCLTTSSDLQWILWLQIFFQIKFDKVVFMISCTRWSINTIWEFCLITDYNWSMLYQINLIELFKNEFISPGLYKESTMCISYFAVNLIEEIADILNRTDLFYRLKSSHLCMTLVHFRRVYHCNHRCCPIHIRVLWKTDHQ